MNEIQLNLNNNGKGEFFLEENGTHVAKMVIGISDGNLTAYHTEVSEALKGQGIANRLLSAMVAYARQHHLKVIPLCAFVLAQFKRHPDQYADIWNQHWH